MSAIKWKGMSSFFQQDQDCHRMNKEPRKEGWEDVLVILKYWPYSPHHHHRPLCTFTIKDRPGQARTRPRHRPQLLRQVKRSFDRPYEQLCIMVGLCVWESVWWPFLSFHSKRLKKKRKKGRILFYPCSCSAYFTVYITIFFSISLSTGF